MKKLLTLLLIGLFWTGCSDKNENCCTNIDVGMAIKYLNEDGENLFEIEDGIKVSEISVFHKINGEWVEYFEGNLDRPQGISVIESTDGKYLDLFPSMTTNDNNISETKIEFSSTDSDIIKTEIDSDNSNTVVTKIWYNEELKWESNQRERTFEVIK